LLLKSCQDPRRKPTRGP
jgi:hypothetical protein